MWGLEMKLVSKNKVNSAIDISHAIEIAFEYPEDILDITISKERLSLPMKYVFSDLLDDFLAIINDLLERKSGVGIYGFSQNNVFDADWHLDWDEKMLSIKVVWRTFKGKEMEHTVTMILLEKQVFLESWRAIFSTLSNVIDFRNIKLKNKDDEERAVIIKLIENK
ncbi:MAG: hypothetical protein FWG40_10360 [Peptococcaceae bacterium]|nr:hypothetical protein [Peptococcaceae bacterium]